jgi:hypothetical protein
MGGTEDGRMVTRRGSREDEGLGIRVREDREGWGSGGRDAVDHGWEDGVLEHEAPGTGVGGGRRTDGMGEFWGDPYLMYPASRTSVLSLRYAW